MKYIPLFLLTSLACITVSAQEKILFVGNSFTHGHDNPVYRYNNSSVTDLNGLNYGGVPGIFKELAEQAGLDYDIYVNTVSSSSLNSHYDQRSNIIASQQWDLVVLQEQSTRPLPEAHGGDPINYIAYADAVADIVYNTNPDAQVMIYGTWSSPTSAQDKGYGGDLQAMQDDLNNAFFEAYFRSLRYAGERANYAGVFRVGDAFMHAIDLGYADPNPQDGYDPAKIYLWDKDDHRHAGPSGGYLSAAVMFGEITGLDPRTIESGAGTPAEALGISAADAQLLHEVAYQTLLLEFPSEPSAPSPDVNTLIEGVWPFNWNKSGSWSEGAINGGQSLLIDVHSPTDSIIANSTMGNPADYVRTLSFDTGSALVTVEGNATVASERELHLIGGLDALGGGSLIRLSEGTSGTVSMGVNSGLGTLHILPIADGTIRIDHPDGTLHFGPTANIGGNISLTKKGPGKLILVGANTFGDGLGNTLTIEEGALEADAPVNGDDSATGRANVLVMPGATLRGVGQITPGAGKRVTVSGGVLAPGGWDAAAGQRTVGKLTINGSLADGRTLSLESGSTMSVAFAESAPGSWEHDMLALVGIGDGGVVFADAVIDFFNLADTHIADGSYTLITADDVDAYRGLTLDGEGYIQSGLTIGEGLDAHKAALRQIGGDIVLELQLTPFAQWQNEMFTDEELSQSNVSGELASPANDGVPNLLKYAQGLSPHESARSVLPSLISGSGATAFRYQYRYARSATDLVIALEVSQDLKSWLRGDTYYGDVLVSENPDGETSTVLIDLLPDFPFARLSVERN